MENVMNDLYGADMIEFWCLENHFGVWSTKIGIPSTKIVAQCFMKFTQAAGYF